MMAVEGTTEFELDKIGQRVGVLFRDVLGQSNVRRKTAPGLAHTLIFFGFLAVQPHSLELMIKGVCPAFEVGHLDPGSLRQLSFRRRHPGRPGAGRFRLCHVSRVMLRPAYLTLGVDANLIIAVYLPDHYHLPADQCLSDIAAGGARRL